jgi:hypothetical protein
VQGLISAAPSSEPPPTRHSINAIDAEMLRKAIAGALKRVSGYEPALEYVRFACLVQAESDP